MQATCSRHMASAVGPPTFLHFPFIVLCGCLSFTLFGSLMPCACAGARVAAFLASRSCHLACHAALLASLRCCRGDSGLAGLALLWGHCGTFWGVLPGEKSVSMADRVARGMVSRKGV